MEKQDADDIEHQALVQRHKADIEASGMSREELIDLLARNFASHNLICSSYERSCHRLEEDVRMLEERIRLHEQIGDLLEKQSAEDERKLVAASNAIRQAVHAGMSAGGRALVSSAGKKGADKRHAPTRELKEWALQEAAKMRGTHMDIAKHLAQRIPQPLATASDDPKRLIYDAVRQQRKKTALRGAPRGFVPLTHSRQP